MDQYLVSVVIPTKNRYESLFDLLIALNDICEKNNQIEVIVHDNSEDNEKAIKFFEDHSFKNIKYFYCKDWLSVGENSDKAILLSSGSYVCFIGDDDAVCEEIVEVAQLMNDFNIDSVSCDYSLYRWPAAIINSQNSFEYFKEKEVIRVPNLRKEMSRILNNGIQNKTNMPGVYHGLVKRSVLDRIYEQTGTFFPGPSPDMANSFALALYVKKHIVTSIPFVIDGYSKASTGHLTEAKAHIGKLEDMPFLPKDTVENWTSFIPNIWLPNTIWPESAIQAMKRCGHTALVDEFNKDAMYIKISVIYPQCKELCKKYRKKYTTTLHYSFTYLTVAGTYIFNKIKKKRKKEVDKVERKDRITISDAIELSSQIIKVNNMLVSARTILNQEGNVKNA